MVYFAEIPEAWEDFDYGATCEKTGARMCLRVTSAVPGLIISGVRWDVEYTGHLKGEGFVQVSPDRRVFVMPRDAAHSLRWIVLAS